MIQGFASAAGCLNGYLDVFFYALLAYVFVEAFWTDAGFDAGIFVERGAGDDSVWLSGEWHSFCGSFGHICWLWKVKVKCLTPRSQSTQTSRETWFLLLRSRRSTLWGA